MESIDLSQLKDFRVINIFNRKLIQLDNCIIYEIYYMDSNFNNYFFVINKMYRFQRKCYFLFCFNFKVKMINKILFYSIKSLTLLKLLTQFNENFFIFKYKLQYH